MATLKNPNRPVYEGNTVQWFFNEVEWQVAMIMRGESWRKPFETQSDLKEFLSTAQPYVKRLIPELVAYFSQEYNIK